MREIHTFFDLLIYFQGEISGLNLVLLTRGPGLPCNPGIPISPCNELLNCKCFCAKLGSAEMNYRCLLMHRYIYFILKTFLSLE